MNGVREAALAGIVLLALDLAMVRPPLASTQAPPGVTITYLANEGVLLSSGSTRVLIDAFFLRYGPEYAIPADSTQSALARALAPFDSVDLVLVTHRHGDHLHPDPLAGHLSANPGATLLASQQVIDSMRHVPGVARLAPRMVARTMAPGTRRRALVNGLPVATAELKNPLTGQTIENAKAGDLFGDILPKGDFQMGLYAQVLTSLVPGAVAAAVVFKSLVRDRG